MSVHCFDVVDLGVDLLDQTYEAPHPGQQIGVSYSKTQVYTTPLKKRPSMFNVLGMFGGGLGGMLDDRWESFWDMLGRTWGDVGRFLDMFRDGF